MSLHLSRQALACLLLAALVLPATGQQRSQQLAPGTMTVIPATPLAGETFTAPRPLRGFDGALVDEATGQQFAPNFQAPSDTLVESTKEVIFRRPVWQLEFAFKPLRMIEVDVPNPETKKYQKKLIWYMIYSVTNRGKALKPVQNPDGTYSAQEVDQLSEPLAFRFFPHFVLEGLVYDARAQTYRYHQYLDQIIPAAVEAIRTDEVIPQTATPIYVDDNGTLNADKQGNLLLDDSGRPVTVLNSVQMSQLRMIPLSTEGNERSIWGVAMWENVNREVDYVSVYVQGLTNAFKYIDFPDEDDPTGTRRAYVRKTLQLNFWRPGDGVDEAKDTIYYGVPLVDTTFDQIEIVRRYQLPGPTIAVYEFDDLTGHEVELFEVESPLDSLLNPTYQKQLDGGTVPDAIKDQFSVRGITFPSVAPSTVVENKWWEVKSAAGESKTYRMVFEPKYWTRNSLGEVEILENIDYLWLYRPRDPAKVDKQL